MEFLTWKPWKGENHKSLFCINILFTTINTKWLWVHQHSDWPAPNGCEGTNLLFLIDQHQLILKAPTFFLMSTPTDKEASTSLASTNLPKLHPSSPILSFNKILSLNSLTLLFLSIVLGYGQKQRHSFNPSTFFFYILEGTSSI